MGLGSDRTRFHRGLTLLEMVIAVAIIAILFAVLVPQLRAIQNSWDAKAGRAENLQNCRILMDHLDRNLSTAMRIVEVTELSEIDGYIIYEDNDANSWRYKHTSDKVKFGSGGVDTGQLLTRPVNSFRIFCYEASDLDTPLNPVTDPNIIRMVKVEATFPNLGGKDDVWFDEVQIQLSQ